MIHYSCDRCRCPIENAQGVRYVVKMEIEATLNVSANSGPDDDKDCLLEMDEMLEQMQEEIQDEDEPVVYQKRRFDLCADCYRKFVKNPIGREKLAPFGFSPN